MASRAMAYRSACIASGVNRSRARVPGAGRGAGTAACGAPGPAAVTGAAVRAGVVMVAVVRPAGLIVVIAVAGLVGAVQGDAGRGQRRGR